jgi:acyl-CoA thioester hydrolase
MAEKQKYPVVVRTEIDYRRAAKLGDRLVIEGWLDRVQRARFWCGFRITRPKDHMLIAQCRQMLALIEMPSGKLLRLPDHWQKYRKADSVQYPKGECQIGIGSNEECIE